MYRRKEMMSVIRQYSLIGIIVMAVMTSLIEEIVTTLALACSQERTQESHIGWKSLICDFLPSSIIDRTCTHKT